MPSVWYGVPFVIVALLAIGEFLCIDATPDQFNAWARPQNATGLNTNTAWQGPPTTPWPALGSKKPYNQQTSLTSSTTGNKQLSQNNRNSDSKQSTNLNTNQNTGAALSYGSSGNTAQNLNSITRGLNAGNIGIALSYGPNFNENNRPQSQAKPLSPTTSQNTNTAKTGPSYSGVVRQNSNDQNMPQGSKKIPVPIATPLPQMGGSQNIAPNINGVKQPNHMTGSTIQTGNNIAPVVDEDEELRQFSETLLRKDVNNAGKYVTINYQGKTTSRSVTDEAPLPLLDIRKEAYNIPSISNLIQLHNNYIIETNANEHVSAQEKMEENTLLDSLLSTPVMQYTRTFLIQKGAIPKDPKLFKDKLKELWFNMYSRGHGKIGSSGFEHVFLAEIKNHEVTGLHNWLYFHDAEASKNVNYLGYMKKLEMSNNKGAILKYHLNLHGIDKPVSSMFIGTSPELEIALYSTCFLLRPDKVCPLRFDGKRFIIRTYTFRYRGKNMIGSAFPEI